MASEKILNQKKEEVTKLANKIKEAKLVLLTDYRGINVSDVTALRTKLRNADVEYKVIKNNITRRALQECKIEGLEDVLEGPTAIAVSTEDATAPARVLFEAGKKMPNLELKAGIVAGEYYDDQMIKVIATIPSREVLLGRLLGSIQAPVANFARVIKQIAEKNEETAA